MSSRVLLLLALLAPGLCSAQAGRFILAVGDVVVARGAAEIRAGIGTPVESGDTIRIGPNSNAQVRLSDESIVGMRPNTVLRLDEYFYSGAIDGREKTIISLVRGGFRTVTGLIGRLQSKERYQVRTPTATVGIRGTHYTLVHCDNDCEASPTASGGQTGPGSGVANGTYGGVSDGRIGVENQTGERLFGSNEYFYVANQNAAPQGLIAPPSFLYDRLSSQTRNQGQKGNESSEQMAQSGMNAESRPSEVPTPPTPNEFVVTEQRTSTGTTTVVSATSFDTAGLAAWISGQFDDSTAGGALLNQTQFTLGAGGQLQSITVPSGCTGPNEECNQGISATLGSPSQFSTATFPSSTQIVHWGAWASGTFVDGSSTIALNSNQQAHFLYAPLTPGDVMASKSGTLVLNSTFPGGLGTTPTNNFGQLASGGSLPQLTVDFTSRNVASTAWSVNFPSAGSGTQSWSFPAGSGALTLHTSGAFFLINMTGGSCTSGSPFTACNGTSLATAKGRVSAIFIGPAGDHAGAAISGAAGSSQFSGVRVYCPTC